MRAKPSPLRNLADGDIALGQLISDPFDAVLRQNGGHGDSN
jgi:hypothetical protein